jgi:hypothetical protein
LITSPGADNAAAPASDYRGFARSAPADIGAFEFGATAGGGGTGGADTPPPAGTGSLFKDTFG